MTPRIPIDPFAGEMRAPFRVGHRAAVLRSLAFGVMLLLALILPVASAAIAEVSSRESAAPAWPARMAMGQALPEAAERAAEASPDGPSALDRSLVAVLPFLARGVALNALQDPVVVAPATPRPTEPGATARPTEPEPTARATAPEPTRRPTEPEPTEPRPTEPRPTEPSTPTATAQNPVGGSGDRLYKSGPVAIGPEGRYVWVANAHAGAVSRYDSQSGQVAHFRLPSPSDRGRPLRHELEGVAVEDSGDRVWVTARGSDRVYLLDGESGRVVGGVEMPFGSGPYGIALSPPGEDGRQRWALVTLHRKPAIAVVDVQSLETTFIEPVWRSPLGIAFTDRPGEAWVTHLHPEGEHPRLSRVQLGGEAGHRVTTLLRPGAASPRNGSQLQADDEFKNLPEGGYLTFRGHPAMEPAWGEVRRMWFPMQYHNFHNDEPGPDSVIQASIRRLDLSRRALTADDKVVLSAVQVHDPLRGDNNPPWLGYGWNASVSGLVDLGFLRAGEGRYALALAEQSDELIVLPRETRMFKSEVDPRAPGLPELRVGSRPKGLVVDPEAARAYVFNSLSFDLSVVDLSRPMQPVESRRVDLLPPDPDDPLADAEALTGARLFFTSADPRISANEKVSCASCHINGEHDGRSWNFEHLPAGTAGQGHGPRAVPSMRGLASTFDAGQRAADLGWGQLHRSGDRDEVQDFEHTIRGPLMGGTGFLGDRARPELGQPNAGLDADLDAMAHFLEVLPHLDRSPYRQSDASLSPSAQRGAAIFQGPDHQQYSGDADCASCHVPESAFLDFGFHDVGQRRDGGERELNDAGRRGECLWCVNTPTLIGVFDTSPWDGTYRWAGSMAEVLADYGAYGQREAAHGYPGRLLGRQIDDLAEFVLSLDGRTGAEEVRAARDTEPPYLVRVEASSHRRIEAWFNEAVEEESATDPEHYRLTDGSGSPLTIRSIDYPEGNGDRVSLEVELPIECQVQEFHLAAREGILDMAGSSSLGRANSLRPDDPRNRRGFALRPSPTITLGGSGYEHLTIEVHDAGPVGPGLSTWSHGSPWLYQDGDTRNPGFIRFEWQAAFREVTGVTADDFIRQAAIILRPEMGDAQTLELRRVLQPWRDHRGGDFNNSPTGGPTWRDHSHPDGRWNRAGASALGRAGDQPSDYDSEWDLAEVTDAVATLTAIDQPQRITADRMDAAFRFWFEHPELDYGYALRLRHEWPNSPSLKIRASEPERGAHGPVLELTYMLPGTQACP